MCYYTAVHLLPEFILQVHQGGKLYTKQSSLFNIAELNNYGMQFLVTAETQ